VLNVLFLSWLYAYYCFDYKWALEGIRLPNRLHFFECNWAYFAGLPSPTAVATAAHEQQAFCPAHSAGN
jgi:etoposide-induced 2.4 mRNA